jgi:hypothetical protein
VANSELRAKQNRRLWNTPIRHNTSKGKASDKLVPFWTQDGQGYEFDRNVGGYVKTLTPVPEGYLEQRLQERERDARAIV